MKSPEKSLYPAFAALGALLLTAAAISASIIYVKKIDSRPGSITVSESAAPKAQSYTESFNRRGSFTTPYGTFTPIEDIMDINEYMTMNPAVLSEKETLPYLCGENGDPDEIRKAVRELSDSICSDMRTETEKAQAIAMWVGTNVFYDFDAAAEAGDLSVTNLEAVFSNDLRTTCGGFSNLYSALCAAQGIEVLNIKGAIPSEGYARSELETIPSNHEWNAVKLDGKWMYSDPTWISDAGYENGEIIPAEEIMPFYALFSFGEMSTEHRIDRCERRDYGFDSE